MSSIFIKNNLHDVTERKIISYYQLDIVNVYKLYIIYKFLFLNINKIRIVKVAKTRCAY